MAEEEEDFLESLENDRSCGRMMLADLAAALNDTVENIIVEVQCMLCGGVEE